MKIEKLTEKDFITSLWTGGKTRQIAIYPHTCQYANRDFIWRLSSADVETESSVFTALPNYNRYISTLNGNITLIHNDVTTINLNPYEIHFFDGGYKTTSLGKCVDFNLMLRKDYAKAEVKSYCLNNDNPSISLDYNNDEAFFAVIFCGNGNIKIDIAEQSINLSSNESVIISDISKLSAKISSDEYAQMIISYIICK